MGFGPSIVSVATTKEPRVPTVRAHARRLSCVAAFAAVLLSACGDSGPSEQVIEARRAFQRRESQEALDALQGDTSPEGLYLKALALHYLKNPEAARDAIRQAIEADPDNVKYRGFELRMRLSEGKVAVADELIDLHAQHPTSAALGLFAFWAHGAKRVWYLGQQDRQQSRKSGEAALAALRSSIALAAEVPELQREQLELALEFRLTTEIDSLVEKLKEVATDDVELLMAGSTRIAVDEARERYYADKESEAAALIYAAALSRATPSEEYDAEFGRIIERHGKNAAVMSLYAVYLARSGRLGQGVKTLNAAIDKQTRSGAKRHLMRISIYLPLERGEADLAEENLSRYRDELADPLLVDYFEGRILFLRKQHVAAVAKMRRVVDAQKGVVGSSRKLAGEALSWINRILADEEVLRRLEQAADAVNVEPAKDGEPNEDAEPNQGAKPVDDTESKQGAEPAVGPGRDR